MLIEMTVRVNERKTSEKMLTVFEGNSFVVYLLLDN